MFTQLKENAKFQISFNCDALRNLVPIIQFKSVTLLN